MFKRVMILAFTAAILSGSGVLAEGRVPQEVAARRSGVVKQTTPSPLNMIYTPIAPCRAFLSPTPISANTTRSFKITGSGDLSGQGGSKTGCGVPPMAKAVAINLTAASPSSVGTLRFYEAGTARPSVTTLSFRKSVNVTSSTIVALSPAGQISAFTTGATKVAGDVTGYFEPQLWAYVGTSGALIDSSGRTTSTNRMNTGTYEVVFDRDITHCSGTASSDYEAYYMSVSTFANSAYVRVFNSTGALADYYFNLHIKC